MFTCTRLFAGLVALTIFAFFSTGIALAAGEVNIYSHRHYETDKKLFKMFEDKTGIQVNVVQAKAGQLIERLAREGIHSPADILMTVDAGRLHQAHQKGLLQPIRSDFLEDVIPAKLREQDGHWFGFTKRARVIVYNKAKVNAAKELSTYANLTHPDWKGRVITRSGSNIYSLSIMASFIARDGHDAAKEWAAGLVNNFARSPKGGDTDQIRAVAAGVADLALVNTYYVGRLLESDKATDVAVGKRVGIFFPNQGVGERGTHVNISGAGVTKSAPNKENAIKLLEFLASETAQKEFGAANHEYPTNRHVAPSALLQSWGTFKEDDIALYLLGKYNADAAKIINQVGWK